MRKSIQEPSFWLLIAANLFCLYYYSVNPDGFKTIVWVYWIQSVFIGLFNFIDLLTVKNPDPKSFSINDAPIDGSFKAKGCASLFFLFHYQFFHLAYGIFILIKVKGKCTTDHISMAGPWLRYRGHLDNISDNMLIGAVNAFTDKTNAVLDTETGDYIAVPALARKYKTAGIGSIVVAEDNYGEGSSREHAAMEPRFLNVKAIVVKSFARIHETNLKKQGLLALTFVNKDDYSKIRENDTISILGVTNMKPGVPLTMVLHHVDGTEESFDVAHTYNLAQINWYKSGSALNALNKI